MIEMAGWDEDEAHAVMSDLDINDAIECELQGCNRPMLMVIHFHHVIARGGSVWIARAAGEPFAVLALAPVTHGVAVAGLLARDHRRWRGPLLRVAARIRQNLREVAASGRGAYRRIEARSWSDHPTGNRLLEACGFQFEAELRGCAPGAVTFRQYAWIMPTLPETP